MTLQLLISKLSEAGGGSRELDAEIMRLDDPEFLVRGEDGISAWRGKQCLGATVHVLPAYTTSLDAAVALVEQKLPGWYWKVRRWPDAYAELWSGHGEDDAEFFGSGFDAFGNPPATPALALCIALLKAIEAQEDR